MYILSSLLILKYNLPLPSLLLQTFSLLHYEIANSHHSSVSAIPYLIQKLTLQETCIFQQDIFFSILLHTAPAKYFIIRFCVSSSSGGNSYSFICSVVRQHRHYNREISKKYLTPLPISFLLSLAISDFMCSMLMMTTLFSFSSHNF